MYFIKPKRLDFSINDNHFIIKIVFHIQISTMTSCVRQTLSGRGQIDLFGRKIMKGMAIIVFAIIALILFFVFVKQCKVLSKKVKKLKLLDDYKNCDNDHFILLIDDKESKGDNHDI